MEPDLTFFYHDRPVLYTVQRNTEKYLISLSDEDNEKQSETFLLVKFADATFALLEEKLLTPKEFFTHPDNTVYLATIEYTEHNGKVITQGEQYADNTTIPDAYLPTADARWK